MSAAEDAKKFDRELARLLCACYHDPLKFVETMFPWGKPGTQLEHEQIDEWQRKILEEVRDGLSIGEAIQEAVASGHGIGKSALISWLVLWAISTRKNTRGIVTANTDTQLKTKTWPELSKWYALFLGRHKFVYTATAIHTADPSPEAQKAWRIDAIPWSKSTPESFAGLHNKGSRVIVFFDEGSAISDKIYEVADGAFTDDNTELLWFVFGNPTRTRGRFFDCFHKDRRKVGSKSGWRCHQVDSRTVRITKKDKLNEKVERYGEDSDYVRVRIRGIFPKVGDHAFIAHDVIEAARGKILGLTSYNFAPIILGLDSAWDGGDEIVCVMRQGLASKIMWVQAKNSDDFALAHRLAATEDEIKADGVILDQAYGTGVYSAGKQMKRKWILVPFAGESTDPSCLNKRAEMYLRCRDWLGEGGAIPDDIMLVEELAAQEQIDREDGKIQLLGKEDLKDSEHLGRSPGRSDALVLTFAVPIKAKPREDLFDVKARIHKVEMSGSQDWHPLDD